LELWLGSRPRLLVVGCALAVVALAALVALVRDLSHGSGRAASSTALPVFSRPIRDREAHASVRAAPGWSASHRDRSLALRSPDRLAVVTVAAPTPAGRVGALIPDATAALAARWPGAHVGTALARQLAGRPAEAVPVFADRRRALVIAVRGRRLAYLVEVLTVAGAPTRRFVEAQLTLATLRLDD